MRITSKTVDVDQFPVVTPPIHPIVGGSIGNNEYFLGRAPFTEAVPASLADPTICEVDLLSPRRWTNPALEEVASGEGFNVTGLPLANSSASHRFLDRLHTLGRDRASDIRCIRRGGDEH